MKIVKIVLSLSLAIISLGITAQNHRQLLSERICGQLIDQSTSEKIVSQVAQKLFPKGVNTDQCLMELVANKLPSTTSITWLIKNQGADGSWSDIDYQSKSRSAWPAQRHHERLMSLARAYRATSSPLCGNRDVSQAIHKGITFWNTTKPECANWWYNEIGVPKVYAPVLLLMSQELSADEMAAGIKILDRAQIKMTGQNKVWLSGVVFIKALLSGDEELMRRSSEAIRSELVVSTGEGIQPDYSFHQHGAQQQFGNYGLAFASSQSYWLRILTGTPYDFTPQQREHLSQYMRRGLNYTVWRGVMDVSACGRQLFNNAAEGKAGSLLMSMINMVDADSAHKMDYQHYISRNYMSQQNDLVGMRHFWRSDYSIYRTPQFMVSVKMCSPRVMGSETTNNENKMGLYLADGATFTYRTGREYENIFPCWDWRRIPGVTGIVTDEPVAFIAKRGTTFIYENKSEYVGGLEFGDMGVTAMDFDREGVKGRKGWFFMPDRVVCLGAEFRNDKGAPMVTAIEQSLAVGDFAVSNKNIIGGVGAHVGVGQWVHHNGIGYLSLTNQKWAVSSERKQGDWHRVADFCPSETLSKNIFSLNILHADGANANYAYAILPTASLDDMKKYSLSKDVSILSNDANVQAVESVDKKSFMGIFYAPTTIVSKVFGTIKLSSAALVALVNRAGKITLAVSDPTQKLSEVVVQVGNKKVKVLLGQGEQAGATKVCELL